MARIRKKKAKKVPLRKYVEEGDIDKTIEYFKNKFLELEKRENAVKNKEKLLEAEKNKLALESSKINEELEKLKRVENALSEREISIKGEREALDKRIAELEGRLAKAEKMPEEVHKLQELIKEKELELKRSHEELKYEKLRHEHEIARLTAQIEFKKGLGSRDVTQIEKELLEREEKITKREEYLLEKEFELANLRADLELKDEELRRKIDPLKYKEEELARREEELRFKEQKLEREVQKFKEREKELKKLALPPGAEEKLKLKEELTRLEEELKAREDELKRREEYLKSKESELTRKTEDLIAAEISRKEKERKREKEAKKVKTGVSRLDDLLFGGIPFGSNVLLYGPPFMGTDVLIKRFVIEGLAKNVPCVVVTVDKSTTDIKKELKELFEDYESAESAGLVGYVDIYSRRMGMPCNEPNVEYVDSIRDLDVITLAVNNIFTKLKAKGEYYRLVFPLSTLTANLGAQPIFRFLEDLTGRCKRDGAVTFFALTKGMHPETDVQIIRHLMDGVIEFKEENLRTFFAVQGICDVQTRSWVQYKFTEKDLIIGSFSLDYIR